MTRILIAEDHANTASFIDKGLRARGYATTVVDNGNGAFEFGRSGHFDLMLLDLGIPGLDGLEVLRQLRGERHRIPVIVLTGRTEPHVVIESLDAGADDYMPKPFRFEELLARINVRLRPPRTAQQNVLHVGGVDLDVLMRRANVGARTVDLTAREFALLELLMRHPEQVLSRSQILEHVWGYDMDPDSNVVNMYVAALRRKLGPQAIESVRGIGYRFHGPQVEVQPA